MIDGCRKYYSYILTKEEENAIYKHTLKQLISRAVARMQGLGYSISKIDNKVATFDFKSKIDEFKLYSDANIRKHWELERIKMKEDRLKKENDFELELAKKCNANYFYTLMVQSFQKENKQLIKDQYSNPYIKTLCFFMSKDPRFESELNLDLNKGLWIYGKAGLGKTRLIEAVANNDITRIKNISMIEIADSVANKGEYILNWDICSKVLFDDVGSEQATVNHFGTKINWFKEYIELYYALRKGFNKLIVTTNCDFNDIENNYGYRVRSRIREMFNIITVDGVDRRK